MTNETPKIWQNENGTWSHRMDSRREWTDREACEMDLEFNEAWARSSH